MPDTQQTAKVALIGLGTVGQGVARLLLEQSERITRQAGRKIELIKAVVKHLDKPRDFSLPSSLLTDDLECVVQDPDISIVVELMGGIDPAGTIVNRLLESGKDIVTANKALLAEQGMALCDTARKRGCSIAFEAAVAGGIPIVANISQCLSANQITSIRAILNGTCNHILTEMESRNVDYASALREAQELGYAEADPTFDIDGTDTVQKLAILTQLAFGTRVHWREIPYQGIEKIDLEDLHFARQLGFRIKLLATAQLLGRELELHVAPTLVRIGSPLAEVHGARNAVDVAGDAVGSVFYEGYGAGQMPTASAVVADVIDTVVGRAALTFETLEPWKLLSHAPLVRDPAAAESCYYLRLRVEDRPSVLAEIAGVLGKKAISIASVIQPPTASENNGSVPLIIMTHQTTAGAIQEATETIAALPCLLSRGVCLPVLDGEPQV